MARLRTVLALPGGDEVDELVDCSVGQFVQFLIGSVLDGVRYKDPSGIEAQPLRLAVRGVGEWR